MRGGWLVSSFHTPATQGGTSKMPTQHPDSRLSTSKTHDHTLPHYYRSPIVCVKFSLLHHINITFGVIQWVQTPRGVLVTSFKRCGAEQYSIPRHHPPQNMSRSTSCYSKISPNFADFAVMLRPGSVPCARTNLARHLPGRTLSAFAVRVA